MPHSARDSGAGTPILVSIIGNNITSENTAAIGFYGALNSSASNNFITMEPPPGGVNQSGIIAAIWGIGQIVNNTIINSANYGIDFGGWALAAPGHITYIMDNTIQNYGTFGVYDNNEHQAVVYVENNLFISNLSAASAISAEHPGNNEWIINGNTV